MGGTNEARAGSPAVVPSQRRRGRLLKQKGWGGGGSRRIVLMQTKVGNLGNLGWTTGYIYKAELVKSGRVQNLGVVMYDKVDKQGRFYTTVPKNGEEEKGGGGRESNYRGG